MNKVAGVQKPSSGGRRRRAGEVKEVEEKTPETVSVNIN